MHRLINLNSLTDIVSNSIGMLVLLALATVTQLSFQEYEVEIPLEHETDLTPVFFVCRDEALLRVDHRAVFEAAIGQAARRGAAEDERFDLGVRGLWGSVSAELGLVLHPQDTGSWLPASAIVPPDTPGEGVPTLDSVDPSRQFAFFFVYDEALAERTSGGGYAAFRAARARLARRGVKTGWVPVDKAHPPHICFWADVPACRYRPSGAS